MIAPLWAIFLKWAISLNLYNRLLGLSYGVREKWLFQDILAIHFYSRITPELLQDCLMTTLAYFSKSEWNSLLGEGLCFSLKAVCLLEVVPTKSCPLRWGIFYISMLYPRGGVYSYKPIQSHTSKRTWCRQKSKLCNDLLPPELQSE